MLEIRVSIGLVKIWLHKRGKYELRIITSISSGLDVSSIVTATLLPSVCKCPSNTVSSFWTLFNNNKSVSLSNSYVTSIQRSYTSGASHSTSLKDGSPFTINIAYVLVKMWPQYQSHISRCNMYQIPKKFTLPGENNERNHRNGYEP